MNDYEAQLQDRIRRVREDFQGPERYAYYQGDSAYFRKQLPIKRPGLEVLNKQTGEWTPFKGDEGKITCFGDRIEEKDLPEGAIENGPERADS